MKEDIKNVPLGEMKRAVRELGLKPYTANQLIQWLYKKGANDFDEMTNLSKEARRRINEKYFIGRLKLANKLESKDGTKKFAWGLKDGNVIESVLIPMSVLPVHQRTNAPTHQRTRLTLCISTQVGCAMGCKFCRTATLGLVRNLTQSEIVGQVLEVQGAPSPQPSPSRGEGKGGGGASQITNIVLMGMGEPLANFDNVVGAVEILSASHAVGLAKRRITISTVGLVPAIERLAKLRLGIKFAVSLNATTDDVRDKLMPINKKYPISVLMDACKKYIRETGKYRVTFEYVMFDGINDSINDAKRLVKLISNMPSKVNLIPVNAYSGSDFNAPSDEAVSEFAEYLRSKHVQVNIRASHGQDILAACGQLAS